jgi:hypothetical protein
MNELMFSWCKNNWVKNGDRCGAIVIFARKLIQSF